MALINFLYYIQFFIASLFLLFYVYLRRSWRYWEKLGVPSKPVSVYGTIKDLFFEKRSVSEQFLELFKEYESKGYKYFGVYSIHIPVLIPIDRELIKNILLKDFDHFYDRGAYSNEEHDPLSAHLVSLQGAKWKNLRQKITPAFTSGKLKKMFQILVESTEKLKDCLDEKVEKSEPIEINKILIQFTTDVIGSCAFGIDCNSFKDPDSDFIKYGSKMFKPDFVGFIKQMLAFTCPSFSKRIKLMVTNKEVDRFYRRLVKDTVEYREKNQIYRNDFLQLLIQLKNQGKLDEDDEVIGTKLTMDEIAAQVYLFFVAGYETTSTTLTFCIYELTKNRHIQDKVLDEIIRVLKKYNGNITYESIMEMQYMDRVISETLRKNTPLPLMNRIVTKDYQIPGTDVVLKKGLIVLVPTCSLHENPEYYPEPEKFDPDRFTEENKANRPDCTFIPFGEGPRFCIGMRFALLEMKICLAQLLLKYKFSLNPKTNDPLKLDHKSFIRCIKGGLWINAEKI